MRTPMARLAALLAVVTAALTAVGVAVASPSSAGGPTSVLLVNPATGRVAALYATDPRYQRLADLVGAFDAAPAPSPRPRASGGGYGVVDAGGVNVTWLVHDVQVWRVDRIHVDAAGHVGIETQQDISGGSIWDVQPVAHEPSNPRDLVALLDGLGLGAPAASAVISAPVPAAPVVTAPVPSAASAAHDTTAAGPARSASAPGTSAALWVLAGAALGAAVLWAAQRAVPAGRSRRSREQAEVADADQPESSPSADVISWGH